LAIGEEFAFMDPRFYFQVIVPTMLTGAAFVGITTLGDPSNFVNDLIKLRRPNGKLLFRVVALELVCERCRRNGQEMHCRHKMGELPYWHSGAKHADVEKIMESRMGDFLRETRGLQPTSTNLPIFDKQSVERLLMKDNDFVDTEETFRHLFISVDPAAGGENSRFAVVSCVYSRVNDCCVIVGADASDARTPQEQVELLARHIDETSRVLPSLQRAVRVFIPESNLGFEAQHMEANLKHAGLSGDKFCVIKEDANRAGVRTTHSLKKMMSTNLEFRLLNGSIKFHRRFFTLTPGYTAVTMKRFIVDELLGFSRILKPSKDPLAAPREFYSGKANGHDDMVMSLCLNVVLKERFLRSRERYGRWQ
jgi:hypothetical protein